MYDPNVDYAERLLWAAVIKRAIDDYRTIVRYQQRSSLSKAEEQRLAKIYNHGSAIQVDRGHDWPFCDQLLNAGWRLSGVFDFEPAMLGHPLYELPAITIFVARGDLLVWCDADITNFDERFVRMWRYYLAYCRAGFRSGKIDVMQVSLER